MNSQRLAVISHAEEKLVPDDTPYIIEAVPIPDDIIGRREAYSQGSTGMMAVGSG